MVLALSMTTVYAGPSVSDSSFVNTTSTCHDKSGVWDSKRKGCEEPPTGCCLFHDIVDAIGDIFG
jgi:predicted HD phosphohydrolase